MISEQTIPPSAKFSKLARQVGFDGVDFIVPTSPKDIAEGETICAINGVSAGGSTGHLLLASPDPSVIAKMVAGSGEMAKPLKRDAMPAGRDTPRTQEALVATTATSANLQSKRELVIAAIATITESESPVGDAGVSFTELGLESMELLDLAEHLSATLEIDLAITDLYQFPTIEELAAHLIAIS